MLDNTWALAAVRLTHASTPVLLTQIQRRTVARNVRTVANYSPGALLPSFTAVLTAEPMVSFETTEIARVLSAIGLDGAGCGSDPSDTFTGVECYYVKKANKGARVSGTAHLKQAGTFAFAVIRRVRAKWNAEATVEVEIYAASTDGDIQPLSVSTGVALPAAVVDQKFVLGFGALNGVEVDLSELEVDFGSVVEVKGSGADIYSTNINLKRRAPIAKIKAYDPTLYGTHDLDGTPIGASNCDFYLRKVLPNGARVADATAEHIRFRFLNGQGMIVPGDDTGSESDDIDADFQVVGVTNGTLDAISITNGIAHP